MYGSRSELGVPLLFVVEVGSFCLRMWNYDITRPVVPNEHPLMKKNSELWSELLSVARDLEISC